MGVRGLETFIKTKVENGTAHVEMEKMIRSHKQGSGKEALIVVDVEGMLQRSELFTFFIIRPLRAA